MLHVTHTSLYQCHYLDNFFAILEQKPLPLMLALPTSFFSALYAFLAANVMRRSDFSNSPLRRRRRGTGEGGKAAGIEWYIEVWGCPFRHKLGVCCPLRFSRGKANNFLWGREDFPDWSSRHFGPQPYTRNSPCEGCRLPRFL